jgi:hypothetical protein
MMHKVNINVPAFRKTCGELFQSASIAIVNPRWRVCIDYSNIRNRRYLAKLLYITQRMMGILSESHWNQVLSRDNMAGNYGTPKGCGSRPV